MSQEPKKVGRRTFLNYAIAVIATGIIVGAATYLAAPKGEVTVTAPGATVTTTKTVTITGTTTPTTPTTTPSEKKKLCLMEGTSPAAMVRIDEAIKWAEKNGVELEVIKAGGMDRFQKLAIATQSGEAPYDVIALWGSQVLSAAEQGLILPLDEYVSTNYWDQFMPLNESIYKGKHYGFPYLCETQVLFYRTDLFKEAGLEVPISAAELLSAGKKLMKISGGVTEVYAWCTHLADPEESMCQFATGLFSNGGDWVIEEGGKIIPAFNGPEGVEVVEWWIKMVDAGLAPLPIELLQKDSATLFAKGKIACHTNWMGQRQYVDDPSISVLSPE